MNLNLRRQIIQHIFAGLAVIPSSFINMASSKSLMSQEFLLDDKLTFESDSGSVKNKIWGCQISSEQQELKILLGDCSQEKNVSEFCLIVQLKDSPIYGVYLLVDEYEDDSEDEALLACSINGKNWLECNTYLQATFLAGMEQIKDLGLKWSKCSDYLEQYKTMVSFIKFVDELYKEKHEGQEEGF